MAGDLGRGQAPGVRQFAGGVGAAGEGAYQPQPDRVGQCLQPQPDRLQRHRPGRAAFRDRILQGGSAAGGVHRDEVRMPEHAGDERDARSARAARVVLQLVHEDALAVAVQGDGRRYRGQGGAESLPVPEIGLEADVRRQLGGDAGPGGIEERLAALLERLAHPGPDAGRVRQEAFGERLLECAPCLRPVQGTRTGPGVGERGRPGEEQAAAAAGRDQRGGHVGVVVEVVDVVEFLDEGRPRPGRQQEIRARRPPQELGLPQPLRQLRTQRGSDTRGPRRQMRVMLRSGEHMQHRRQLGERRGGEAQPFRRYSGDVDAQSHPPIIAGRRGRRGPG